jgi:hypothetical protein
VAERYTRRSQTPLGASPCGFESHHPHWSARAGIPGRRTVSCSSGACGRTGPPSGQDRLRPAETRTDCRAIVAHGATSPAGSGGWRPFEQLEAFAKDKDDPGLDAWRNYWKRAGKSTRVGISHETFVVRAGEYEAVYGNMPPHGLAKASTLVPLADSVGARQRLKATMR